MKWIVGLITAFLAALASGPVKDMAPDCIYWAIAQQTLGSAESASLLARETGVKQFIAGNGGDSILRNYLTKFAPPVDHREWYVAQPIDAKSRQLGYYYVTHPLTSGPDVTLWDCTKSALELQVSPTLRGFCALSEWDAYQLTGDASYARGLLTFADDFVAHNADGKILWTRTTVPAFGITRTPWISALTQSVVVSALLRAYQYTGDRKYLLTAKSVYRWLTVPVLRGGVLTTDQGTWFEEYPDQSPSAKSSHVLNGDIWALFGVWDYYRVTQSRKALALFKSGVAAVKQNMSWYDLGYWNVYSRLNHVDTVTGLYMQFMIQQMYALAQITRDPSFRAIGEKWATDQRTNALFVHDMVSTYRRVTDTAATSP